MGFFTELALWLGSFQFLPDPCTRRTCCKEDSRASPASLDPRSQDFRLVLDPCQRILSS